MTDKANAPQGGVTDAMVRRGLAGLIAHRGTYEGEEPITEDDMRAALEAALQSQASDVGRLVEKWRARVADLDARIHREMADAEREWVLGKAEGIDDCADELAALPHQPAAQGSGGEEVANVSGLAEAMIEIANRIANRAGPSLDGAVFRGYAHELRSLANSVERLAYIAPSPGSSEGASHE